MAYAVLSCVLIGYAAPSSAQLFRPLPPASAPETAAPAEAAPPAPQPAAAAPAAAQPQPSDEARERARDAYARGQALFAEAKFAEAEAAFIEAYAAVPNPVVLLGKAECEVRLGKLEDAYATFELYLKQRPDAPDRAEVEKKAAELAALPATVALRSEPAGAAIRIDGQDTGKLTPAEIAIPRGSHRVELVLAGYDTAGETVETRIGARHELEIGLRKSAPKPAETAAAEVPGAPGKAPAAPSGPPTTALWITGIIGASGLITGTVLGFMVLAQRSDYDAKPTESAAKRGERLALFTDVAFGMGAMALVTCAVLYLTSDRAEAPPPSAAAPAASFKLAPAVLARGGAGVLAQGRF